MPELPDIMVYLEALQTRIVGRRLHNVRIHSPFLVRSFEPSVDAVIGRTVGGLQRLGKRIVIEIEQQLYVVLHLMIAGRLHWKAAGVRLTGKNQLAAFDFEHGTLLLTEAGAKRRAALFVVQGEAALQQHNPGGLEIFAITLDQFQQTLQQRNHTVKRALADPRLFSGIGNAYSDEILHRAQLSPFAQTQKLAADDVERLFVAVREVMQEWIDRLRREAGEGFPQKVTAFRKDMAVHGRYGKPCPVCGAPVQRIRYADNETNYCPKCQTQGQILADRSLSRLLKDDWPKHLDDL